RGRSDPAPPQLAQPARDDLRAARLRLQRDAGESAVAERGHHGEAIGCDAQALAGVEADVIAAAVLGDPDGPSLDPELTSPRIGDDLEIAVGDFEMRSFGFHVGAPCWESGEFATLRTGAA